MSSSVPFFQTATGRRPWSPSSETPVRLSVVHMAMLPVQLQHPPHGVAASTLLGPQRGEAVS